MKAYMTSYKKVRLNGLKSDKDFDQTEYFSDPQDALNFLVQHGVDTAAKETPENVRTYANDGRTMQIISTSKRDEFDALVILSEASPEYNVLGCITQVTIK